MSRYSSVTHYFSTCRSENSASANSKSVKTGKFNVLRIGFVGSQRAATLMFDIHDLEQFGAKLIWAGGLGPGPGPCREGMTVCVAPVGPGPVVIKELSLT